MREDLVGRRCNFLTGICGNFELTHNIILYHPGSRLVKWRKFRSWLFGDNQVMFFLRLSREAARHDVSRGGQIIPSSLEVAESYHLYLIKITQPLTSLEELKIIPSLRLSRDQNQTIPTSLEYQNHTILTSLEGRNHTISTYLEGQNHTISTSLEGHNHSISTFLECVSYKYSHLIVIKATQQVDLTTSRDVGSPIGTQL